MNRCCIYFGTGPEKHHYVVQLFLDWVQCVSFFPTVETHTHFLNWKNDSNDDDDGNLIQIDFFQPVFSTTKFLFSIAVQIYNYPFLLYTILTNTHVEKILWNNFDSKSSWNEKIKIKTKQNIHFQWKTIIKLNVNKECGIKRKRKEKKNDSQILHWHLHNTYTNVQ